MTTAETGGNPMIDLSVFEAECLQLIDEVAKSGTGIIITRDGRPVAWLVPYRKQVEDWPDATVASRSSAISSRRST